MSNIIDCKEIRDRIIKELKKEDLSNICGAFIQVGNNPASNTYVNNKIKLCKELNINYKHLVLLEDTTEDDLLYIIKELNEDNEISGIMVQLPLPAHISEEKVINAISPDKDIDGFTNVNKGKLMIGDDSGVIPCTPKGIMTILEAIKFNPKGKDVVIVGRSNIVGKPLANLLINAGATVTVCNSSTPTYMIERYIESSDLFIPAIGKANYWDDSNLPLYLENTIAIDVGINRDNEGKLCGDIDKSIHNEFKAITSVPGGVGVMTVLEVIRNLIKCSNANKSML